MTNIVEIKINKTVFKFIETVYEVGKVSFIKSVEFKYRTDKIKISLYEREHNPVHVHILYNNQCRFRFKIKEQEFYKDDIIKNKGYINLKNKKNCYDAVIRYFKTRKKELIESFYILNPTLK